MSLQFYSQPDEGAPTPLEPPCCDHPTSTCLPFSAAGPVGGVAAAGPVEMPAWPFTYGFPPLPLPACPLRRLRGPVGGVAPIREVEDALGVAEDEDEAAAAAADPWIEFKSARGARGGALPDMDEQGGMEGRGREGGQSRGRGGGRGSSGIALATSRPCATSWATSTLAHNTCR